MNRETMILKLHEIGAVKFGEFTLKCGITSPIYLDLRLIVSYPQLLQTIADTMWKQLQNISCDIICGVPYTALPIATAISLKHNVPMVMRRKEVKDYGTKRAIEGKWEAGDRCLIIEDLVTSGMSVFETIEPLEKEGLTIQDIVVLINREQGGKENITSRGYTLHAVLTITEIVETLCAHSKITQETVSNVLNFITAGV